MKSILEKIEDNIKKKPWKINASRWLSIHGIKEPWIAEISPYQYARMSNAEKKRYDKKRDEEWKKSGDAKKEWADLVYKAYKDGKFELNDKDVHPEAKQAAKIGKYREDTEAKDKAFEKADKENRIKDISKLSVGDNVYSVMFRDYVEIKKVSKKSVIVDHRGRQMKTSPMALQWLSYDDLKSKIFGGNK